METYFNGVEVEDDMKKDFLNQYGFEIWYK